MSIRVVPRDPEERRAAERGMAIEDIREAARLTQHDLAGLLGLSSQTVSNIERAYSGVNDLARIERIADVCAGKGWLTDDPNEIRRYILGDRSSLPLKMERRIWHEQGDGTPSMLPWVRVVA